MASSNCFSSAVSTAYSTTTITTPFVSTTSVTVTSNVLVTSTETVTNLLGQPSFSTIVGRTASTTVVPTTTVLSSTSVTSLPVSTIYSTFCSSVSSSSSSSSSSSASSSSSSSSSSSASSTASSTTPSTSLSSTTISLSSSTPASTVSVSTIIISPSASGANTATTSSGSSVPIGAIVGGVIGGLVVLGVIIWLLYKCCVGGEVASRRDRERPLSPGFFGDKYSTFDAGDQRRSYDERSVYAGSDSGRPPVAGAGAMSQRRDSARSGLSRNMSASSRAVPERQMSTRRGSSSQPNMGSASPGMAGVGTGVFRRPSGPQAQAAATPPGFGKPVPTRRAAGRLSLGSEAGGDNNFAAASPARGIEDGLNPSGPVGAGAGAAAGAGAGRFAGRIGSRRRSGGGLARVPSSGAATARSMPRLQPVETLARDTRHANRGGLRVMNEEPEDESVGGGPPDAGLANVSPPIGGGGAAGYRRASYDPHSLRPTSPEAAATSPNSDPSLRTSLTQRALEARNQTDPEAQSVVSDRSSVRRWLGFGLSPPSRPAPSRGPPSYRTHA